MSNKHKKITWRVIKRCQISDLSSTLTAYQRFLLICSKRWKEGQKILFLRWMSILGDLITICVAMSNQQRQLISWDPILRHRRSLRWVDQTSIKIYELNHQSSSMNSKQVRSALSLQMEGDQNLENRKQTISKSLYGQCQLHKDKKSRVNLIKENVATVKPR